MENSLKVIDSNDDSWLSEDRNTKKVRFKYVFDGASVDMVVDSGPPLNAATSWTDKLFGTGSSGTSQKVVRFEEGSDEDFILLDDDIIRSTVNGIPAIEFFDRVKEILSKEMEMIGPWIIFGQYLTVQPWTKEFSPLQPYPSVVMAWIRLPGLLGFMYKRKILEAIGSMISKVVKFDFKTDNRTRGKFTRMALFINLDKPLISQICVNGEIQQVEYEALPTICFTCGKYGHVRELCSLSKEILRKDSDKVVVDDGSNSNNNDPGKVPEPTFRPWMLVERKSR
ncbi:uncharacterized protein LOC108475156 [Gossypium arboreum]|uniref:CCHC-type domain-containing protein n=1 Tax=Gossypium arboreum TaxID=29729 RepID=A0ABR0QMK8_GOSAR|nr:uncharacterized protein LOC108475156 [Gossypium arboreum]KAK5840183.1 hypothetical protein PVK06_009068 [Gossypium arboreum]